MAERWHEGIWLGTCMKTNEHFVGLSEGRVVRARTVKERPSNMQVTRDELNRITQGPWESTGVILEGVRRGEGRKEAVAEEQPKEKVESRGVKITKQILERVGYSSGCQKCKAYEMNNEYKLNTSH